MEHDPVNLKWSHIDNPHHPVTNQSCFSIRRFAASPVMMSSHSLMQTAGIMQYLVLPVLLGLMYSIRFLLVAERFLPSTDHQSQLNFQSGPPLTFARVLVNMTVQALAELASLR